MEEKIEEKIFYKNVSPRRREYLKKYLLENKEKKRKYDIEYRKKNAEKLKLQSNLYCMLNKDEINKRNAKYRASHKEEIREYHKKNRSKYSAVARYRYSNDSVFALNRIVRSFVLRSFKDRKIKKSNKTEIILGCSFDEFKKYIESKFEPWMNWENRGLYNGEFNYGWDLDHIIPISSAKTEEDIIKLNHYTNFQPLCSNLNRNIKKNKLDFDNETIPV